MTDRRDVGVIQVEGKEGDETGERTGSAHFSWLGPVPLRKGKKDQRMEREAGRARK